MGKLQSKQTYLELIRQLANISGPVYLSSVFCKNNYSSLFVHVNAHSRSPQDVANSPSSNVHYYPARMRKGKSNDFVRLSLSSKWLVLDI